MDDASAAVLDLMMLEELVNMIKEFYPSEQSDSESTTGDCQGLHSLRSAAYGGGSGDGYGCMLLLELTGTR